MLYFYLNLDVMKFVVIVKPTSKHNIYFEKVNIIEAKSAGIGRRRSLNRLTIDEMVQL